MQESVTPEHSGPEHLGPMHSSAVQDASLPRLVKLYIKQVAIGFGLSAVFVGLLLGFDVAGLRSLILNTQGGAIAAFLLFFFNGLVFAGVQFAISIMRMAQPEDKGPRGGRSVPAAARHPARVHVALGK